MDRIKMQELGKILPFIIILSLLIFSLDAEAKTAEAEVFKCTACHSPGSRQAKGFSEEEVQSSIHSNLSCISCHSEAAKRDHKAEARKVDCAQCHAKESQGYYQSIHGKALISGIKEAPNCVSCHGSHGIQPVKSPQAPVSTANLVSTCLSCHADERIEEIKGLPKREFFISYSESVHGRISPETGLRAAVCNDCHGSHAILPSDDPESQVHKKNIADDCGSCHQEILKQYSGSIHGTELHNDNLLAPTCTDCHGEHRIAPPADPGSLVFATNIPITCSHCHEGERLAERFISPGERLKTYLDSYHGLAIRFGETMVANCASCHGIHDIRPSADPLSSIHPDNLSKTCGKCHPGAGEKFKIGKVHVEAKPGSSLGKFLVRQFYIWFIMILVAGFLTHIILEAIGRKREKGRRDQHG
ncbi:MAG: cytochrome c3 family protein [Acidobacteriota bacterium]